MKSFFTKVRNPLAKNVDHDMKEAHDLRDTHGRDPAFQAAKALESAIKIISDEKQLSTGSGMAKLVVSAMPVPMRPAAASSKGKNVRRVPRVPQLVAIVEMIRIGGVKIDGPLYQSQA